MNENTKNLLLNFTEHLKSSGLKVSNYAIADIEKKRSDREISILNDKRFDVIYRDGSIDFYTGYSGQLIDDKFIEDIKILSIAITNINCKIQ